MQAYIAFVEGGLHACTHKHGGEGERDQTAPPPHPPHPPPAGKKCAFAAPPTLFLEAYRDHIGEGPISTEFVEVPDPWVDRRERPVVGRAPDLLLTLFSDKRGAG